MATAAIDPIVSTAAEFVKDLNGFSRKHRVRRDSYHKEKDRLLDRIADTKKSGADLTDEDKEALSELRERFVLCCTITCTNTEW